MSRASCEMEIDFWVGRCSSSQRVDAMWKRQLSGFATSIELATVAVHSPKTHAAAERPAVGDIVLVTESQPRLAAIQRGMPIRAGARQACTRPTAFTSIPTSRYRRSYWSHSSRGR